MLSIKSTSRDVVNFKNVISHCNNTVNSLQMPPPEYSTAYQTKLDQISEFRRELQVTSCNNIDVFFFLRIMIGGVCVPLYI